jgi:putative flippase GtrA
MTESGGKIQPEDALAPSAGLVGNLSAQSLLLLLNSPNHPLAQMVRFGVMTIMSASMTVGLPIVLHELFGVRPEVAAAIAFASAFLLNFLSLRRLVFRSNRGAGHDFVTFLLSSLVFRGGEYLAFLATLAVHVHYIVGLLSVLTLSALAKFFWYRRVLHGEENRPAVAEDG